MMSNAKKHQNIWRVGINKKFLSNLFSDYLIIVAIVIILIGIGMSVKDWQSNNSMSNQAAQLINQANRKYENNKTSTNGPVPSTTKPSMTDISSYEVPPDLPRYLIIPKLGVYARILSVGLTAQGALSTPGNVYDTAWYNQSAKPGQPGATLIDGHISSWTTNGVFYYLKALKPGDEVKIERGDGKIFTYQVIKSQTYNANNVDMAAAVNPVNSSSSGLNLISCSGYVLPGTNDFNQRILVFTSQI